jgi:DNA (cytosine-5)-methyltransferase 1
MKPIRFGSACSGIEAASVAWHPLGWQTAWLAEIEPFPSAVLAHHYPNTPNLGDMTTIARRILTGEVEAPDVFAGGTPCQAFSVAGLRKSLDDARGNLSLKFVELADAIDHVRTRRGDAECVVFWENVPGVLSTPDNAFGCFLAGLAGEDEPLVPPGKRWGNAGCVYGPRRAVAWRTLDAQYFGVAQRRRRVFVVASARDGFDPAQVLFEWEGVRRDLAPRRVQAEDAAGTLAGGSRERGGYSHDDIPLAGTLGQRTCDHTSGLKSESDFVVPVQAFGGNKTSGPRDISSALSALSAHGGTGRHDFESETFITHAPEVAATMVARSSRGGGQTNSPGHNADEELVVTHSLRGEGFDASEDGTGRGTPLVPVAFDTYNQSTSETAQTLCSRGDSPGGNAHLVPAVMQSAQVRRLMPTECELLQGFQRGYTLIPWRGRPAAECPDGPRYKALGNSWAVPVAHWAGKRIDAQLKRLAA